MKRYFSMLFILFTMIALLSTRAEAICETTNFLIYYDDGSYATITLDSSDFVRSSTEKYKTYTFYNPLGQKCFAYTLVATFTYNGTTSYANSCDFGVAIYRQGWNLATHSESISGNTAYGNATFTNADGQTRSASLSLTCDKNGNVT